MNRVCEWKIEADWDSSVELTIEDMNLEHAQSCVFDSLKVSVGARCCGEGSSTGTSG